MKIGAGTLKNCSEVLFKVSHTLTLRLSNSTLGTNQKKWKHMSIHRMWSMYTVALFIIEIFINRNS
jgi:hypothetical protein